ncbi:MAG: tetratricopeptide repeat protein [Chitinophagaceae bacterium]
MNTGLVLLCLTVGINTHAFATTLEGLGDRAYVHSQYDSAVIYYQEALHADNSSAINWFKLGNAQYRMRHFGEAVLAYERCLDKRPSFAAATKNISHIQQIIQGGKQYQPIAVVQLWRALVAPNKSNFLAWLGLLFVAAPLLLLAFGKYRKSKLTWLWPQAVVGSIVLGVVLLILSSIAAFRNKPSQIGVVMRQDAVFQETINGISKTTVINLPEGLLVKISGKKEKGIQVILPDGRIGLIQQSDIAIVE